MSNQQQILEQSQHSQPQQQPQPKLFYGWIVTIIAALGVFFSGPGQTYSISIFIESIMKEFGWSSSLVSGIYSAATLLAGLLLFIVGRSVDRFGQRRMAVVVGSMLALACFWNSIVANTVMLFIGFFFLRLFGQGSMTLLPNTLVPQWFIAKRGRALSIMAVGGFLSSALFPLMNVFLIETFNWRVAWQVWAVALAVVFVPIAAIFIRNKPEDIGLLPDGRQVEKGTKKEDIVELETNWTLQEARRTRAFWLILFCSIIPALVNTGVTFHLVTIFAEANVEKAMAALVLSIMAFIGFPFTFISGFLVERIKVNHLLTVTFLGNVGALLILLNVSTALGAILYGVIWGMVGGIERIAMNIVWPNYFGRKHIGSIKGIAMTGMVIGSAFGPLPFGIAYDLFGQYNEILLLMIILPFLGAIAAFVSPPPIKQKSNTA
ncbi:MFS transporter [Bacillus sp. HMF5848]|uniref:MFS transporter n=1 Tax=Bacillus sp. HMF5848 TaxID=2495421 RepID=UPI000F7825C4|nr:MFS transporter [Bacillus sp. HMF5848]RSK28480.1 MFS transporter [Bacillus sp. HMF5848]